MNDDVTIVMLTPNKVPQDWAAYHRRKLLEAAEGAPIILVSNEPARSAWCKINLIQTEYGLVNVYTQMLRAFKLAETPFVAMADDDTLYPVGHFRLRPPMDAFGYNMTRWHLFTWGDPIFFYKPLPGNGLFIGPRELSIKALETRLEAGMPDHLCHELGTRRSAYEADGAAWTKLYTTDPVVSFYHEQSVDKANQRRRKKMWPVRAIELPYWGRAEAVRSLWK